MPWIADENIEEYLGKQFEEAKYANIIGFGTAAKLIVLWLYFITKLLVIIIEKMDK
jgi:hypothetical protein